MSMLQDMLSKLNIPEWKTEDVDAKNWESLRKRIIDTLLFHEYGIVPPCSFSMDCTNVSEDANFYGGKATLKTVNLTIHFVEGVASFPAWLMVPNTPGDHPLFVHINFHPGMPNRFLPAEEICDRGYAVLEVEHNSISPDARDDFADGLGALLRKVARNSGVAEAQLPGKIAIWAWAASRTLDWALGQAGICSTHIAVIGHSRLGKTALLCGALDERISCVISNDSGCSGAAITRGKEGEHVSDIIQRFPHWFCEAYRQYASNEMNMPFEQDWLLAAIAPRLLLVGSALLDKWCGPTHEYLSCVSASKAWTQLGKNGFIHPDQLPLGGDVFHQGDIGYHLRNGSHYLNREDWNNYINFLDARGWTL